ncbi:YciI family protein [Sinomonas albida]|uniref:YciI family protein n=1 Tax=Sinomonas albida TaxID=369942 RepID=UPI003017D41D
MALYAVIWTYTSDADLLQSAKPAHGAFVRDLASRQVLLEAGAWSDGSGALLVVNADSADEVDNLLADDPYVTHHVVTSSTVREWGPVLGALT